MDKLLNIETIATFTDIKPSTNPSFHQAKTRIMAIESIANKCHFSRESVINGLPTLKNVPIVTYYNEKGNLGDHEVSVDIDGQPIFRTYGIGVIPESAEQWIEEVEENGQMKQYLCSDVLLWKRQKREYEFIQNHKELSVSMEVQITSGCFSDDDTLNIDSFYFTAVTVLGIGVIPAFDSANLTFSKQDEQFQQMMFDLQNFNGVGNMQQFEDETQVVEQEVQQETVVQEEKEEVKQPEIDYKKLLEEEQVESGRTIRELTQERDALTQRLEQLQQDSAKELAKITEELEQLRDYKKQVEKAKRETEINGVLDNFKDLQDVDDFKEMLKDIDNLTPQQLEDKCYAIVGKQARAKRQKTTQQPAPKINITASHKESQQAKDDRYGGLLYK